MGLSSASTPRAKDLKVPRKPAVTGLNRVATSDKDAVGAVSGTNASSNQGAATLSGDAELKFVDVVVNEDGTYQSYVSCSVRFSLSLAMFECVCVCV